MNYKTIGYNSLVTLQEMLISAIVQSSAKWDNKHIEGVRKIHALTQKLLTMWNSSIIETTTGYELVPGTRNRLIGYMTKIIVQIQLLSQDIDNEGQILLEDIDGILEELSDVILGVANMKDSA